jgi:cobalt-zinc-cadmium efflux system membrane fusion protein
VNAEISTARERIPLWIPQEAVATLEGRTVVFIPAAEGFKTKTISTGRSDRTHVEVVAGLSPGDPYVAKGAFEIKAILSTGSLGAHAGHGH